MLFAVQCRRRSTIWFVYAVNTVTMLISSLVSFYYGIWDLNLLLESGMSMDNPGHGKGESMIKDARENLAADA